MVIGFKPIKASWEEKKKKDSIQDGSYSIVRSRWNIQRLASGCFHPRVGFSLLVFNHSQARRSPDCAILL